MTAFGLPAHPERILPLPPLPPCKGYAVRRHCLPVYVLLVCGYVNACLCSVAVLLVDNAALPVNGKCLWVVGIQRHSLQRCQEYVPKLKGYRFFRHFLLVVPQNEKKRGRSNHQCKDRNHQRQNRQSYGLPLNPSHTPVLPYFFPFTKIHFRQAIVHCCTLHHSTVFSIIPQIGPCAHLNR